MHPDAVTADMEDLDAYRVVNEHFAQAVAGVYKPGDVILVYNFELLLLPQMLRRRITDDPTIGTFLDCPLLPNSLERYLYARTYYVV